MLVLHTLPPAECGSDRWPEEFALTETAEHVASVLEHAVVAGVLGEAAEIVTLVEAQRADVVFNLCEAPLGKPGLEAHAAALLEWMGVPFTGSGSETLALCRRKPWMNAVLAAHGVAVPRAVSFQPSSNRPMRTGRPVSHADSVCVDANAVERARARWPGPVMIEEFVPGREFAVSLWGGNTPEYVSIGETLFRNGLRLNTYAAKWDAGERRVRRFAAGLHHRGGTLVARTGRGGGARGLARRRGSRLPANRHSLQRARPSRGAGRQSESGRGPGVGICRAVEEAGWTWESFVRRQVEWAYDR